MISTYIDGNTTKITCECIDCIKLAQDGLMSWHFMNHNELLGSEERGKFLNSRFCIDFPGKILYHCITLILRVQHLRMEQFIKLVLFIQSETS
jgi:hypothetical protein